MRLSTELEELCPAWKIDGGGCRYRSVALRSLTEIRIQVTQRALVLARSYVRRLIAAHWDDLLLEEACEPQRFSLHPAQRAGH